MRNIFLAILLAILGAASSYAQVNPPAGQITAQTTNATCVGGVQNGGAVDLSIGPTTSTVGVSVTGTYVANMQMQLSTDHGKTWTQAGPSITSNQQNILTVAGYSDLCVFAIAYTSGTAIITFTQSPSSSSTSVNSVASQVTSTQTSASAATLEANAAGFLSVFTSLNGSNTPLAVVNLGADPCQASGVPKLHAFANITTATTTALVAVSGSTTVFVCEIDFELASTTSADTVLFEQGTGVACASSPVALTSTYTNSAATFVDVFHHIGGGSSTNFKTAASNGLCAVSTVGSTPTISVDVEYVQQ
jgi:hypothetical protein